MIPVELCIYEKFSRLIERGVVFQFQFSINICVMTDEEAMITPISTYRPFVLQYSSLK